MAPINIDFEKVCRLCFREDDGRNKMTSICGFEETIRKCVQIEVYLGIDEPSNMCASCMLSLDSWSKFKALCDNTNAFLQQYIQEKNDLVINSEITNLGTLGFTPSHMSDLSIGFFDSDSLWNNISQQWNYIDPTSTELPAPRSTKKVQPSEDLTIPTLSGKESLDTPSNVLHNKIDNHSEKYWWNPKAISMKAMQKENDKSTLKKGFSKSMIKYNLYERKNYRCSVCSKNFTKFNDLLEHDSIVHVDMPKTFSCEKCGKLFLSKDRLETHKIVHREKLFECQLCQKKFTVQKSLDRHLNVHIGSYTCQKCGYKAHNMYNLKIHESSHSLVKTHCCEECEKSFSTLSSLRRHDSLIHKKIFLFRCDQCDYSTVHPSSLKYHKSTHVSEAFICDHCGSSFKNEDLFNKHKKIHQDIIFSCTHCKKVFKKKSNLKEHLRSSHKLGPTIKKHKCDVCEQFFMSIRNLRFHKNRFHTT